jgi:hypothetical protein
LKYFHGEITSGQRVLVYEFNITNTESSINSSELVDVNGLCSLINNEHCNCGYTRGCECLCRTTRTTTTTTTSYRRLTTTTTTLCPNFCWCGFSYNYNSNSNCSCECSFAVLETPHILLRWDQIGTDLDLHVVDPNEVEINVLYQSWTTGGKILRDRRSGPNAVELISWGLIQDGIRGPNGNYKIYVKSFRISGRTPYSIAVLENPNQGLKYFHGEITSGQRVLVYEFNITNTESSINSSEPVDINGLCSLIRNDQCECGYTNSCECPCAVEYATNPFTTTTSPFTITTTVDWIMEEYWYWYWATYGQVRSTTTTSFTTTTTVY